LQNPKKSATFVVQNTSKMKEYPKLVAILIALRGDSAVKIYAIETNIAL